MYPLIKRFFDFVFSVIGLLIISPLFIPIIIANRLTGEGEIFYGQTRVGYKTNRFGILKFATMLKNSPSLKGGTITMRNDPRITPMGKYLRITKLNELPQLLNVIKGDMSFVGPRPLMPKSFSRYTEDVQGKVYDSVPGITGIGSIIFRDEEKMVTDAHEKGIDPEDFYDDVIFPYKGQLELWYRKNKSFWTDFKILVATAWVIIRPNSEIMFSWFKELPKKNTA